MGIRLDLDDDPDPPEVAIFCPGCLQREFGDHSPSLSTATHRPRTPTDALDFDTASD
jgi:hypothetical protein